MASGEINEALTQIGVFAKSLRKSTKEYSDFIDQMARQNGTDTERKDLRAKERSIKASKQASDALEDLQQDAEDLKTQNEKAAKVTAKSTKAFTKLVKRINKVSPSTITESMKESFKDIGKDSTKLSRPYDRLNVAMDDRVKQIKEVTKLRKTQAKSIYQTNYALKDKVSAIKSNISSMFSLDKGIALVVSSITRIMAQNEKALGHQIGMYSAVSDGLDSFAFQMSLTPEAMQDFAISMKTIALSSSDDYDSLHGAMGNTVKMMSEESKGRDSLTSRAYDLTGSYENASKLLGSTMNTLKSMGGDTDLDQLGEETHDLISQFEILGKMSGKSTMEIGQMSAKFMESDAVRTKMMRMRDKTERLEFIKNTNEQAIRNKKLGISIDKTLAMAEQAAAQGDKDYLTKLKESFAMAQAAQMAGLGNDIADEIQQLGVVQRDADQEKRFTEIMGMITAEKYKLQKAGKDSVGALMNLERMMPRMGADNVKLGKDQAEAAELSKDKGPKGEGWMDIGRTWAAEASIAAGKAWDTYAKPLITEPIVTAIIGFGKIIGALWLSFKGLSGFFKGGKWLSGLGKGVFGKLFKSKNHMDMSKLRGAASSPAKSGGFMKTAASFIKKQATSFGSKAFTLIKNFGPSIMKFFTKWGSRLLKRIPVVMAASVGTVVGDMMVKYTQANNPELWDKVVDKVGGSIAAVIGDGTATVTPSGSKATPETPMYTELVTNLKEQNVLLTKQNELSQSNTAAVIAASKAADDVEKVKRERLEVQNDKINTEATWEKLKKK